MLLAAAAAVESPVITGSGLARQMTRMLPLAAAHASLNLGENHNIISVALVMFSQQDVPSPFPNFCCVSEIKCHSFMTREGL
jgi:hypothetical protein